MRPSEHRLSEGHENGIDFENMNNLDFPQEEFRQREAQHQQNQQAPQNQQARHELTESGMSSQLYNPRATTTTAPSLPKKTKQQEKFLPPRAARAASEEAIVVARDETSVLTRAKRGA